MWANDCTKEQTTEQFTLFPRFLRAQSCRIGEQPNWDCRTTAWSRE